MSRYKYQPQLDKKAKRVESRFQKLLDSLRRKEGKQKRKPTSAEIYYDDVFRDKDLMTLARGLEMEPIRLREALDQIHKAQKMLKTETAKDAITKALDKQNLIYPLTKEEVKQPDCEHFWQVYRYFDVEGGDGEEIHIICAKCLKKDVIC